MHARLATLLKKTDLETPYLTNFTTLVVKLKNNVIKASV